MPGSSTARWSATGRARRRPGSGPFVRPELARVPEPERDLDFLRLVDGLPVDDLEKQRVVEECRRAFSLNTDLFRALEPADPLTA
ncbi:biliverdin-producing heme oxygenase [Streptomyces sp. NBC_01808]|uniref:hypothetical protein n=1 Tax=Streptomyces sp. NBC_01808 TaxID=2975947 RepID=UPI0030925641|nr:biliverdin-producing heme oxygenase [Streptomyces sp. NBC_01808]